MPLPLSGKTVDISLVSDEAIAEAGRPAFQFRFPSARTLCEAYALYDEAEKLLPTDSKAAFAKLNECIGLCLVGWRNVAAADPKLAALFGVEVVNGAPVALPFRPDLVDAVLSVDALWELAAHWPGRMRRAEREMSDAAAQSRKAPAVEAIAE